MTADISQAPTLREQRKLMREFRKEIGITLVQLARLSGMSHPMLCQFETGERDLSSEAWQMVRISLGRALTENAPKYPGGVPRALEIARRLGVPIFEGLQRDYGPDAIAALKARRELIERLADDTQLALPDDVREWLLAELKAVHAEEEALVACACIRGADRDPNKRALLFAAAKNARVITAQIENVKILPTGLSEQELTERLTAAVECGEALMRYVSSPEEEAEAKAEGWTDDLSALPARKPQKPVS